MLAPTTARIVPLRGSRSNTITDESGKSATSFCAATRADTNVHGLVATAGNPGNEFDHASHNDTPLAAGEMIVGLTGRDRKSARAGARTRVSG